MSSANNTLLYDLYHGLYHRILGRSILTTDIDAFITSNNVHEGIWMEYKKHYDQFDNKAIFDYKRVVKNPTHPQYFRASFDSIKFQKHLANQLNIPFFLCLTYLDPEWFTKAYFVLPVNDIALDFFMQYRYHINGHWMTLQQFSKFHHRLRGLVWDQAEKINSQALATLNFPPDLTLGDLDNTAVKYPLPNLFGF